jgi:dipeptidyl aminopeptidase/acylaminoacyl peptidase
MDLVGDHGSDSAKGPYMSTWAHYWEPRSSVTFAPWTQVMHEMSSHPPTDGTAARRLASPINHVTAKTPPLLIFASACDYSGPLANNEAMVAAMKEVGAPCEFESWPGEGHMQITDLVIARTLRFLQERFEVLGKIPAPAPRGAA